MKIIETYIVKYRKPYCSKMKLVKLYETENGKYFLDYDNEIEEIDSTHANEIKKVNRI